MKRIILIFAITLSLASCGWVDRQIANVTGTGTGTCYKGVEYVQFPSGASVAYNTDGTVKLCGG